MYTWIRLTRFKYLPSHFIDNCRWVSLNSLCTFLLLQIEKIITMILYQVVVLWAWDIICTTSVDVITTNSVPNSILVYKQEYNSQR